MKKMISCLVIMAMLLSMATVVFAATGVAETVDAGVASAEVDCKYPVRFETEGNGTLTITVGDGNSQWVSNVFSFVDWSTTEEIVGCEEQTYTVDVTPGTYFIRFYGVPGADGLSEAISGVPYSVTFTPSGEAVIPTLDPYAESETVYTAEGTYDAEIVDTAEVTLYRFSPSVTGQYSVEVTGADVELWSTAAYTKMGDAENGALTLNATALGQEWFIAVKGDATSAQITITRTGDATAQRDYEIIMYELQDTPVLFDPDAYELDGFVDFTDDVIDTAVLGEDGYYHLNSADGPILFADFFGVEPSLGAAWGYGNVSYVVRGDDDKIEYVINYQDALGAYMMAENNEGFYSFANAYHPLTAELIEMIKNIGKNNGWYEADGLVGDKEDGWMFACVTMISLNEEDDENPGGNTGNAGGNTGDTGNEGGNTGNAGGNTGDTGNAGGNTGNTGNEGGNTGNAGGNTGNAGGNTGDTGNAGGNTGNTGNEGGNTGNAGGNTGNDSATEPTEPDSTKTETPKQGDLGVVTALIAMAASAAGAALVAKKKED